MREPTAADGLTIAFDLCVTFDRELSCVCCNGNRCTFEFMIPGDGRKTWFGVHLKCLERTRERLATAPGRNQEEESGE